MKMKKVLVKDLTTVFVFRCIVLKGAKNPKQIVLKIGQNKIYADVYHRSRNWKKTTGNGMQKVILIKLI